MAHDANDILGPITLKGEGPEVELLDLVTRYKGRNTQVRSGTRVELSDRNLTIVGFWPAVLYLKERYPEPVVMPETPPQRAIIRSLVAQLFADPPTTLGLLGESYKKGPHTAFMFSDEPTLLDFAIACVGQPYETWAPFVKRVRELVSPALRAGLQPAAEPWEQQA